MAEFQLILAHHEDESIKIARDILHALAYTSDKIFSTCATEGDDGFLASFILRNKENPYHKNGEHKIVEFKSIDELLRKLEELDGITKEDVHDALLYEYKESLKVIDKITEEKHENN